MKVWLMRKVIVFDFLISGVAMLLPVSIGICGESRSTDQDREIAQQCPSASAWMMSRASYSKEDATAPLSDRKLHDQLIGMADLDQHVRAPYQAEGANHSPAAVEKVQQVDKQNIEKLRKILDLHNRLPFASEIGADGVRAAMLITQHADADVKLQRRVLDFAESRAGADVSGESYALLKDRVSLREGKPQLYGSQFQFVEGALMLRQPSVSRGEVDSNRKKIGLMPLDDYACVLKVVSSAP